MRPGAERVVGEEPRPDIELAERLFDALRATTGGTQGITRASYGHGEAIAHRLIADEAERLGLAVRRDPALNLFVTLKGEREGPALLLGSHLDSVPSGGNFDGAAGVLAGLAVVAGFVAARLRPSRDITVVAIRAEESAWFNASYIGSRAALGLLEADELDTVHRSDDGRSLAQHMAEAGADLPALRARRGVLDPGAVAAFIEPHIEQGPVLMDCNEPIAVVTSIRGSIRFRHVTVLGEYAHSGVTARAMRRDAVVAAADLTLRLDEMWRELEAQGEDLTLTIGQFSTDPLEHAFSKVAGRVDLSVDLRSASPVSLARAPALIESLAREVATRHGVAIALGARSGTQPAEMDAGLMAALADAADAESMSLRHMPCGAGHDAAMFQQVGIPTAMLFIRNDNGSHNPREAMTMSDFARAADVLMRFCRSWSRTEPQGA